MTSTEAGLLGQIERIAQSDTFRNCDGLRRLLHYLAEKSAAGEAAQLKEYTVGVDGLNKPATYDPRHDAAVRIQVGRLRQKLTEYYHTEGKDDPLIVDLPKGQFGLVWTSRGPSKPEPVGHWRRAALVLTAALAIATAWGVYSAVQLRHRTAPASAYWTTELQQIWRPFTASDRSLAIVIADPLFVQFKGFGAYRSQILNTWDEALANPSVAAIRKTLKSAAIEPNSRYTTVGEANAAFLLGRFLSPHVSHLSLERSSELSWHQLANNNVIYVGAERTITQQLQSLPMKLAFSYDYEGIINFHPAAGEPALFEDPPAVKALNASEDGDSYALISRIPGPAGQGEMITFASNTPAARLAAVQSFTTAADAKEVLRHLTDPSGELPRYYQVILKIRFKAGVPVATSFVRHRRLDASPQ